MLNAISNSPATQFQSAAAVDAPAPLDPHPGGSHRHGHKHHGSDFNGIDALWAIVSAGWQAIAAVEEMMFLKLLHPDSHKGHDAHSAATKYAQAAKLGGSTPQTTLPSPTAGAVSPAPNAAAPTVSIAA